MTKTLASFAAVSLFISSVLMTACGGGSDAKVDAAIDAKPIDALVVDAPAALVGLGQKCVKSADCPTTTPGCLIKPGAAFGFCSAICHMNAMFMTDAASMISGGTDVSLDDPKCVALFTGGTAGVPKCNQFVNRTPSGALMPNTTYTVQAVCNVACTATNTCPSGMTCNMGNCEY